MGTIAYIDADLICYKAGFVSERSFVTLLDDNKKGEWKNKTEARSCLVDLYGEDEAEKLVKDLTTIVVPNPKSFALATTKAMIKNICDSIGATSHKLYIDGEGNFRNNIWTIQKYKDRTGIKPYHYTNIREYLINTHKAIPIEKVEADDAISIAMYYGHKSGGKNKHIGCTIDKDAKNTPGWLFNWDKMEEPYYISELEALQNFYSQLLTGDTVDTIRGCRGIGSGDSGSVKVIKTLTSQKDMYQHCLNEYTKAEAKAEQHRQEGKGRWANHLKMCPKKELEENAHLLWMLRHRPKFDNNGNVILEWKAPV